MALLHRYMQHKYCKSIAYARKTYVCLFVYISHRIVVCNYVWHVERFSSIAPATRSTSRDEAATTPNPKPKTRSVISPINHTSKEQALHQVNATPKTRRFFQLRYYASEQQTRCMCDVFSHSVSRTTVRPWTKTQTTTTTTITTATVATAAFTETIPTSCKTTNWK